MGVVILTVDKAHFLQLTTYSPTDTHMCTPLNTGGALLALVAKWLVM